ncbi:bZIP transcription factor, partial [Maribacter polysaccharolyticus]|uniref:bZIP transcription factor n=1 Tax=Maribacter polysaccharolyticus TaxID=3020831 RepID=UPI00237FB04C
EIQTLSVSGDQLSISGTGGNTVTIPSGNNLATSNLTQTTNRTYDLDEFDLNFDITNSDVTFLGTNGNVGIGISSPQDKLDVDGQIRARNGYASTEGSSGNPGYGFYTNNDTNTGMYRIAEDQLGFTTGGSEAIRINASQNVGIGPNFDVNSIDARLHVEGDIRGDDIYSNGAMLTPDYVFQKYYLGTSILNKEYTFNSLPEIERYIKKKHHLPGVKSAKEIKEQGFWNLGEASRINLEKIEELFLHTIAQEKKIDQLQKENQTLTQELEALKGDIALIKQLLQNQAGNQ